MSEINVLCILADPSDQPRFSADSLWEAIRQASELSVGRVTCERLAKSTAINLEERLLIANSNLIYFAGHAECRAGLNYVNVALESASGQTRSLNGTYFASALAACRTLQMVVLQACDQPSFCFDLIAAALLEKGVRSIVMIPALTASATGSVFAKLFAAVLAKTPLSSLESELRAAHPQAHALKVVSREVAPLKSFATAAVVSTTTVSKPIEQVVPPPEKENWAQAELRRKRETGRFDVFLCHNSSDKNFVVSIAQKLKDGGILPWLDIWELPPGKRWQLELERQIPSIRSAAVFVGAGGVGPWQEEELYGFLLEFVERKIPLIPVLLPNVAAIPVVPIFLRLMTWVDFRQIDPDPIERLIWGITGERPLD